MFRRIVSNLSFSPALVGQLGFYARRLRKEESTRRVGLIFTALALVVQSLAVFSPPEAANAASAADFIPGGVSTKQEYLNHYDNNTNHIKGLLTTLGITRAELAAASKDTIPKAGVGGKYNWSRTSLYSAAQGERAYTFNNGGPDVTFFYRPLALTASNPPYNVLVGNSAKFGWFAVKLDCGNLITKTPPPPVERSVKCESLKIDALGSGRYRVTITASKKNANITGYTVDIESKDEKRVNTDATTAELVFTKTDPGTYTVRAKVLSDIGTDGGAECKDTITVTKTNVPPPPPPPVPTPIAACELVQSIVSNRTVVSLAGRASVGGTASIRGYTFTVKNASGSVVKRVAVSSASTSVYAESFDLATPGTYSVELVVSTSLGERTAPTCATNFVIAEKAVCQYNPSLPPSSPDCQPCPDNPTIWIKDEKCSAKVITTKTSTNMTQGNVDASTVIARASDKVSYTLTIANKGIVSENVTMSENLADVLEYATVIDNGGGTYDQTTKTLSWPSVRLAGGEKQSRTIAVQLMAKVPSTNTGVSNEASYDCKMVNTFGNSITVDVECAPEKVIVEQVVGELPQTGPRENMMFAAALLAVVTYFYARSRQLGKEVRLIRRNLNTGTI